jgi:hypothetical protein
LSMYTVSIAWRLVLVAGGIWSKLGPADLTDKIEYQRGPK